MKFFSSFICICVLLVLSGCIEKQPDARGVAAPIEIIEPYSFMTPPNAKTGAGFMVIKNLGNEDDALISATSEIAEITEIHENLIDPDDGTMMMRKIKSLAIPANEKVELTPKGYHIMFIKLNEQIKMGEIIPVTLNFEKAGKQNIGMRVVAPGAPAPHVKH